MAQQVSVEAALSVFRQRCGELNDENLMLRARVAELEAELARRPAAPPADGEQPTPVSYLAGEAVPSPS